MGLQSRPWDSGTSHGNPMWATVGWDGQVVMGLWDVPWESHVHWMVQWDGMDRWDCSLCHGTVGRPMGIPCGLDGTVGWDGQVGLQSRPWDCGTSHGNPMWARWYSGMGWTGGIAV